MAPNHWYETLLYPEVDDRHRASFNEDTEFFLSSSSPVRKVSFDDVAHERYVCGLEEAIHSIHVMDSVTGNEDFLQKYQGELYGVPLETLRRLDDQAPSKLAARVADFNGNLCYEMQTPNHLAMLGLERLVRTTLGANDFLGSYLTTESTVPQPAHVDYSWEVLDEHPHLYLGFFPLTNEGMYLQVWPHTTMDDDPQHRNQMVPGEVLFIPYGRLLVLPARTIHAGGFRTTPLTPPPSTSSSSSSSAGVGGVGSHGNLRFHLYLARGGDRLPQHQTNKYTEPHDKRRELCERHVDAPSLSVLLQQHWFT